MKKASAREAILDAAQELIQTRGANAISYQHISEMVGIQKASIHYHFPTKNHLVEEVLRRYCARFLEIVDRLFASDDPAPAKLRKYAGLFEATLADGPQGKVCLCGMLGAELASLGDPAVGMLHRFYRQNAERLGRVLEEGRKARTLTFAGDPPALGMLIFSGLEGAMMVSRAGGGVKRFRSMTREMLQLVAA